MNREEIIEFLNKLEIKKYHFRKETIGKISSKYIVINIPKKGSINSIEAIKNIGGKIIRTYKSSSYMGRNYYKGYSMYVEMEIKYLD